MFQRRSKRPGCLTALGFGLVSFPVLLLLAPNIEMNRGDFRRIQAFYQTRIYAESDPSEIDTHFYPETDPWGKPLRIVEVENEVARVISSGPNMSSPESGFDEDDIYNDMTDPPPREIYSRIAREWRIAFGMCFATWLFLMLAATFELRSRGHETLDQPNDK